MDFSLRFPIPDSELDEIGNWHSPYFFLAFFMARIWLFERIGISQNRLRSENLAVIIKILGPVEFIHPLRRGDIVLIKPALVKLGNSSMKFYFEVFREEGGGLYATGETVQLLADRATGQPVSIPSWMREKLQPLVRP